MEPNKKKKVIDLTVIDQLIQSGVDAIALVEDPAIEINFLAFKKEAFVEPTGGETQDEFIGRCIGVLVGDEGYEQDQAAAICYSTWENRNMEVVVNAPAPYVDQTGESNKKKKKPILEARPVLMSADQELLIAYFSQVGISETEFKENFANADLVPWQEGDIMPADGAGGRTYYKYVSSSSRPAQRDFCRQMMALDRLYTFEEIDTASGFAVNPGFGEGGGATYDIWKYKGGPNCKHYWQKMYATVDKTVNKGPATGKAGTPMIDQPNQGYLMSKMYFEETEDQRILVGPAMVPDMEIPRYDKKNNEIYYVSFSEEAIAKIAEKFMREQSTHNTNQDHDMDKPADTYIFESWLVEDPATDKANTVYGYDVPKGSWMVKMRVNSDAVWQRVKSGELKGFSVEGNFVTEEELAEIEAAGLLSKISEIVA